MKIAIRLIRDVVCERVSEGVSALCCLLFWVVGSLPPGAYSYICVPGVLVVYTHFSIFQSPSYARHIHITPQSPQHSRYMHVFPISSHTHYTHILPIPSHTHYMHLFPISSPTHYTHILPISHIPIVRTYYQPLTYPLYARISNLLAYSNTHISPPTEPSPRNHHQRRSSSIRPVRPNSPRACPCSYIIHTSTTYTHPYTHHPPIHTHPAIHHTHIDPSPFHTPAHATEPQSPSSLLLTSSTLPYPTTASIQPIE